MAFHQTLEAFIAENGRLVKPLFTQRFQAPFLLLHVPPRPDKIESFDTRDETELDLEGHSEAIDLVVPLVKSDRNTFEGMITVGRATNNDVVIPHPSVSKFHAYFAFGPGVTMVTLSDAGSSYGTFLGSDRLEPGVPRAMATGDVVLFAGSVTGTLLTPADLFERVQTPESS